MKWNPWNTKIGIALGGGAAKGIAHIGILKALEEAELEVHAISGTSIGALIASYYAFGKTTEELEEVAPELNFKKVFNLGFNKLGILNADNIREMLERDLGKVHIEDAKIPLAITATDIESGEQIVLKHGPLADAVCASVSVPGIFAPVEYKNRLLVDGGITENVPLSPLRDMGVGIFVGVDLNATAKYTRPKDIFTMMGNAMDIAIDLRTRDQLEEADIICSLDLSKYNRLDNSEFIEELIEKGKEEMNHKMNSLKWYRSTNYYQFLKKLFWEVLPLRIPRLLKWKKR